MIASEPFLNKSQFRQDLSLSLSSKIISLCILLWNFKRLRITEVILFSPLNES